MDEEKLEEFKNYVIDMLKALDEKINAINEKVDALDDIVVNQIMKPTIELYQDEQYQDFRNKYGERLNKYDLILKNSLGDDYDSTKETWDSIQNSENPEEVDIEATVQETEKQTLEFVNKIRQELGLPPDEAVTITDDGNGNIEVVADENGDGKPETPVETSENSESTEENEENELGEVDPKIEKELEEYLKG